MRRTFGLLLCAVMAGVVMTACGHVIVDWADFLKLDGKNYSGDWGVAVADPAVVEKKVNEVKFELSTSRKRNNPNYKIRNGDAAFLPEGTEVFAIKGYPEGSIVAVRDATGLNGYKIYREDGTAPVALEQQDVDEIRIYSNYEQGTSPGELHKRIGGKDIPLFFKLVEHAKPGEYSIPWGEADNYLVVYVLESGLGVQRDFSGYGGSYYDQDALLPDEISRFF
ncbi:hypothetical protein [Paenibacillus nasutitermitis]|uniref:Lipoprotein n=1 Tax=Paenibacillus nasutitermitis TaxID=1652958 RepID=A0A917DXZ8_9BACL|nr:hypothetical protein [Paenibacillus nasutitermitis]GGD77394.1 hypothetical protein GCM10010911_39280 [Paenibacillus nasutitermitis]